MARLEHLKRRLFRWQDDGSGTFTLGQRRIFILPSKAGLLFAAALLVMLLGAINYQLALGHALVFLLAGLGLSGMIHTFRNLHGLQITPGQCPAVFAGDTAYFELILENTRPAPRHTLCFVTGDAETVTRLAGLGSQRIRLPVAAVQRGWLHLPRIRLYSRYPLGLFTAWSYLQPDLRCLVYPQPIISPLPTPNAVQRPGGDGQHGGDDDFAGLKARQTEPLHHVAWKASARSPDDAALLVKQFAGTSPSQISLDWQSTDPALPTETRLSILTGWVLEAEAQGLDYRLQLPGQTFPASHGPVQRSRCLEALALYSA